MQKLGPSLDRFAFHLGHRHGYIGASFVDNLWFFSHSVGGALAAATAFEQELRSTWRLVIKGGSHELLLVNGCPELANLQMLTDAWPGWSFVQELGCLGMRISWDGSVRSDLVDWRRSVLQAMARNSSGLLRKVTNETQKKRHLDYRAARWPLTSSTARFLDAVQRCVISATVDLPRSAGEDIDAWQRRRSRRSGDLARQWGLWSRRHEHLVTSWWLHLGRPANAASLAAVALSYRNAAWRRRRRLAQGSSSGFAGRLNSRVLMHVNVRWEDSLPTIPAHGRR